MRKPEVIAAEITALKSLRPRGAWALKTLAQIKVAIEELEFGVDTTAAEWGELTLTQQDVVMTTRAWKEGLSNDRPSEGWGDLVEETTAAPAPLPPAQPQQTYTNGNPKQL